MRKSLLFIVISLFLFMVGCGAEETSGSESKKEKVTEAKGVVAEEDIDKMYSDPKKYKGYEVELTGIVFNEPETDDDGVYFQMFADPVNSEKNTLVGITDTNVKVKTDDYVKLTGIVQDEFEGENAFGGVVKAPVIEATKLEVVDYVTAVAPAKYTIDINEEINQHGYHMELQKVEVADEETRVYLKITNESDATIDFYSFNAKLLAGNKQLEENMPYLETGLPELQSEILPGVETEGVIIFPAIDESEKKLTFHAEGSSENYELDYKPFTFEINID
ncbi:MAG TPA: DUF4352 domain-containing protein [Cerasibacillus sp.]|uniref:DUF4352 domain-containing protein n=1 Tax=Cerasibacillus sp. TaxID=2498711 RepID=UPI002F3FD2C7